MEPCTTLMVSFSATMGEDEVSAAVNKSGNYTQPVKYYKNKQ